MSNRAAAASLMKGEEGPCMDSAIDTPMAGERWHRGGGNDGRGGNERQTTERRCLNPPTAIRPGLNTAPPHISKGQGRYKGWLVLQKAYCSLVYVDWHQCTSSGEDSGVHEP